MNSRQLQYAVVLSRILNVSQAAEQLHITQPALSKQILALEKELGVVLFDRSVNPLRLTQAGEFFVKEAEEFLFREKQIKHSMETFKEKGMGRLTIGISPFRAGYYVSDMIKALREKYDGLQIVLHEAGSEQLHRDTVDGKVDFSLMNLPVDEALLDVIALPTEPVVLVLPKPLLSSLPEHCREGEIDLACCKELPFIALGAKQELRQLFDKMCMTSGFTPYIAVEVVGILTAWSLAKAGIAATVLPQRFVEEKQAGEDVVVCHIQNALTVRRPAIIRRKGQYISKYAQEAINFIVHRQTKK